MTNKKGNAKAVAGIIGGTVAVLIGAYLLSPIATATSSTWQANNSALCTVYDGAGTCTTWAYEGAGTLMQNLPLFAVLGIVVTAIVVMVLGAFKSS